MEEGGLGWRFRYWIYLRFCKFSYRCVLICRCGYMLSDFHFQRVQFNRETMQAFKSNAYVKFEETLLMDRFLANSDPVKKAHSKSMELELASCRERLRALGQVDVSQGVVISQMD